MSDFIEEHRPLLEEDDLLSYPVLCRMYAQGAALLKSLSDDLQERKVPTIKATELLTAAIEDPHCSAGTMRKREKEQKRLLAEFERVRAAYERLDSFVAEVQERRDSEFEEDGTPKEAAATAPVVESSPSEPEQRPWWHRLFARGSETAPETRSESQPTAPEPPTTESDHEDYEKLLAWYEVNLEVLEKAVATRQRHEAVYEAKPEMVERWQATYEKLNGEIEWACRNMDYLEQRNADIAVSELVRRRESLAARRSELEVEAS